MEKPKLPPVEMGSLLWGDLSNLPRETNPIFDKEFYYQSPSRVNSCILDFTEMRPNLGGRHCNSGSIGFGVGLYSKVKVKLIKEPKIVFKNKENNALLNHFAIIIKKLTDYRGGFEIEAEPNPYSHTGLGSTASLTCALVNVINIALGNPFDEREVVKIEAFNYVEEGKDGNLYPGQSTGMSGWVSLKGGFMIITAEAELVLRQEIPDSYKVVVGIPPIESKGVAESDIELPILERFSFHDRINSAKICHWTLMKMIPALKAKDFKQVGILAWEMLIAGTKGVPAILAFGSIKPLECLLELKQAGAEMAFMSSVGPGLVVLTSEDKIDAIKNIYNKHNCQILVLEVDNKGGQII